MQENLNGSSGNMCETSLYCSLCVSVCARGTGVDTPAAFSQECVFVLLFKSTLTHLGRQGAGLSSSHI